MELHNIDILLKISLAYSLLIFLLHLGIYNTVMYLQNSANKLNQLKNAVLTDSLSGLYNRKYFELTLEYCGNSLREKEEMFSLIYLDIDNFKNINDSYGHAAGDIVIKEISRIIENSSRSCDVVSRIGGDEFTVLLPGCSDKKAYEVAERLRSSVEKYNFNIKEKTNVKITVSVGVINYSDRQKEVSEIKEEADKAMYMAKKCGKNTVCMI